MKEKNYAISLARFVAMISILCCHAFEWIGYTLDKSKNLGILGNYCAVGVPIFLIISGYLYGSRKELFEKKSRFEFIVSNLKKVLLDYYVYVFAIIIPVYFLLSPEMITVHSIWGLLTCSGVLGGVNHLWFIPYILLCYILTPLLFDYKQYMYRKGVSVTRILEAVLGSMLVFEMIGVAFNSYFKMVWINSYVLGFFLPDLRNQLSKKVQIIVTIVLFLASAVINLYRLPIQYELCPTLDLGIKYQLCDYYINYSYVLFGLVIFMFIMLLDELMTTKDIYPLRILKWSDKYSYDVYLTHMIYAKGVLSVLDITRNHFLNLMIMFILTGLSAIILFYLCDLTRIALNKCKEKVV